MIGHDHITPYDPTMAISRVTPFVDENVSYFVLRETSMPILGARCDKINRLINPNTLEPPQMFAHRTSL